jgi:hypothetical protein
MLKETVFFFACSNGRFLWRSEWGGRWHIATFRKSKVRCLRSEWKVLAGIAKVESAGDRVSVKYEYRSLHPNVHSVRRHKDLQKAVARAE